MPKVIKHFLKTVLLIFVALTLNLLTLPQPSYAADCGIFTTDPAQKWATNTKTSDLKSITIGGGLSSQKQYVVLYRQTGIELISSTTPSQGVITIQLTNLKESDKKFLLSKGKHWLDVRESSFAKPIFCSYEYEVIPFEKIQCGIEQYPAKDKSYGPGETVGLKGIFRSFDPAGNETPYAGDIKIWLYNNKGEEKATTGTKTNADGYFEADGIKIPSVGSDEKGWWTVRAGVNDQKLCHNSAIYVSQTSGEPPVGTPPGGGGPGLPGKNPCEGGVCKTALGDIPTDPAEFAKRVLEIAVGIGGGLALILMVVGAIKVLTSTGDQQKLTAGRDMIVAAVAGLLFIIFSVLILKFIGIEILGISF